jgi:hypothetical protein
MSYGCQLECCQTEKPDHTCPCYNSANPPMLEFVHLAKHDPTSIEKIDYHYFFFVFGSICISVPTSSSFALQQL